MSGVLADVKCAGPLIQEQAQIEGARIQNEPSMAVQVLIRKRTNNFMHRVFIATNAFGFAHGLQCTEDLAHLTAQAPGVMTNARKGQFSFADMQQTCDVTGVLAVMFFFSSSQRV